MPLTENSVEFDIDAVPFSAHGSWLDLSRVVGLHRRATDLHLVSHRTRFTPILKLLPWQGESPVPYTVRATGSVLSWVTGKGDIEAVFDGPARLRLRGIGVRQNDGVGQNDGVDRTDDAGPGGSEGPGVGLRLESAAAELTPFSGTYLYLDPATGQPTFTSYETGRRYRVTVLDGTLTTGGTGDLGRAGRFVTADGPGGRWEILVEEYPDARAPLGATSFEKAVDASRTTFAEYRDRIAGWRTGSTPAAELAAYVLWSATVAPDGFLRRESVLMSKHWMDKVWSWDHCFNALALAEGDPRAALDQFLTPFDHQAPDGALPDSVAHSEILYNFVKPPVHGWALRHLLPHLERPDRAELYGKLSAWSRFWLDHRRAPGHDLAHYQHGNDSGWDNSTTFDDDRVTEAPDLAAFLVLQFDALADLAPGPDEAAYWRERAEEMLRALMTLWDGDRFVARSALTGEPGTGDSLLDLLPIVLGERLPPQIRPALFGRLGEYLTAWGAATQPPASGRYQADGYWRGPIWAPSTVLIEDGLRRAGETALADRVSASFRRLCEAHGFAENFDALTGEGLRDRAYTWTASAYLFLARRAVRDGNPEP